MTSGYDEVSIYKIVNSDSAGLCLMNGNVLEEVDECLIYHFYATKSSKTFTVSRAFVTRRDSLA